MFHILTVEYYLAIKMNKLLIHGTTLMNHRNMLSERSQIQQTTYCMNPLTGNVQKKGNP